MSKKKRDKRAKRRIALPVRRAETFKDKRTKRLRTRQAQQDKDINDQNKD